jgi:multiple sugar transport system permease protein
MQATQTIGQAERQAAEYSGKPRRRIKWSNVLTHIILSIGVLIVALPFVWMLVTSLKSYGAAASFPSGKSLGDLLSVFIPDGLHFENYSDAWNAAPFSTYFVNTIIVAVGTTTGVLITSVFAAYAFAKIDFKGSGLLFILVLSTMMIPHEATYIPNFVIVRNLGWYDTYAALIIPWIASPFSIFLLRQFFRAIPTEMYEAAQLDGCTRFRFLWQFVVPLSKPALITAGLNSFIASWNSLLWPLIAIKSENLFVLQRGLSEFLNGEHGIDFNLLMAASAFTILPIVLIYAVAQKQFVAGIATSGLKG